MLLTPNDQRGTGVAKICNNRQIPSQAWSRRRRHGSSPPFLFHTPSRPPFPASALTLAIRQSEWESDRHNCHRKCLTALRDIEFVTNGPCLSLSLSLPLPLSLSHSSSLRNSSPAFPISCTSTISSPTMPPSCSANPIQRSLSKVQSAQARPQATGRLIQLSLLLSGQLAFPSTLDFLPSLSRSLSLPPLLPSLLRIVGDGNIRQFESGRLRVPSSRQGSWSVPIFLFQISSCDCRLCSCQEGRLVSREYLQRQSSV
jgi:hypothetical protein